MQSQMRLPRAWQRVLSTVEVRSRAAGATGGLQPLFRTGSVSRPSPRVCDGFLAHLVGKRSSRFRGRVLSTSSVQAGAGGEEPWRGRQRGRTALKHQPLANGAGAAARAGHVLRANESGRLGLGKVRLWESEELMSEIQLPVI